MIAGTLLSALLGLGPTADGSAGEARIVQLVSSVHGHCALRDDGRAVCWGRHPSFPAAVGIRDPKWRGGTALEEPTLVRGLPPLRAIALAENGWGVTRDGRLVSWGAPEPATRPSAGGFDDIVAAGLTICASRRDATIVCWEPHLARGALAQLRGRDGEPLPSGDLRDVHGGATAFLIDTGTEQLRIDLDDAWEVRGTDELRADPRPLGTAGPSWESAYARRRLEHPVGEAVVRGACILADGRVWCWPTGLEWSPTPQVLGRAEAFGLDDEWACLGHAGRVRCHVSGGGTQSFELGAEVAMVSVRPRRAIFGTVDGRVLFVDSMVDAPTSGKPHVEREVRVAGTPLAVSGGMDSPCIVVRDHGVQCFVQERVTHTKVDGKPVQAVDGLLRTADGGLLSVLPDGTTRALASGVDAVFAAGPDLALVFDGGSPRVHGRMPGAAAASELAPLQLPAELAKHSAVPGRASLVVTRLQTCVLVRSGEVHCTRPTTTADRAADLPVAVTRHPWRTRVELPHRAKALTASRSTICAWLDNQDVACWGRRYGGPVGLAPAGELTDRIVRAR